MFGMRADIQLLASNARNFAEWRYATVLSNLLEEDDILIIDGSLQTSTRMKASISRSCFHLLLKKTLDSAGFQRLAAFT